MLRSGIDRRRSAVAGRRSARRARNWLGFEALENRWALSAAAQEVPALEPPVTPMAVEITLINLPPEQPFRFIGADGGFVPLAAFLSSADVAVVFSNGELLGNVQVDSVTWPIVRAAGATFEVNSYGASRGIVPTVFVPIDGERALAPSIDPVGTKEPWRGSERSEGGSIPIEIVAKRAPDPEWNTEQRTMKTLIGETGADASESSVTTGALAETPAGIQFTRSSPRANREISGEWARAMVFEIAGGEPATFGPQWSIEAIGSKPLHDAAKTPRVGGRISSEGGHGAVMHGAINGSGVTRATTDGSGSIASEVPPGRSNQFERLDRVQSIVGLPNVVLNTPWLTSADGSASGGANTVPLGDRSVPSASTVGSSKHTDAGDDAIVKTSDNYDAQRGFVEGLPLVVFLALEWIAVRNWRRANEKETAVLTGPPRLKGDDCPRPV